MKDFIYNYVGKVDISEHINNLKSHNWEEWTYRQDTWQVHSQTRAVPIIADETYTNKGKKSKYYKYYENLLFNVNPILKKYYGNGMNYWIIAAASGIRWPLGIGTGSSNRENDEEDIVIFIPNIEDVKKLKRKG